MDEKQTIEKIKNLPNGDGSIGVDVILILPINDHIKFLLLQRKYIDKIGDFWFVVIWQTLNQQWAYFPPQHLHTSNNAFEKIPEFLNDVENLNSNFKKLKEKWNGIQSD